MVDDHDIGGRRFRVTGTTGSSDISEETVLEVQQDGDVVWGAYAGGPILKGYLLGRALGDGRGIFRYIQIGRSGAADCGHSSYSVLPADNGAVRLIENYTWTSKVGSGVNILDEIRD